MSRVGKEPIEIPSGVTVTVSGSNVKVKGSNGNLEMSFRDEINVKVEGSTTTVTRIDDTRQARALHGLTRSLIANMIQGVSVGFEKKLEIVGVGYRADVKGSTLNLLLGFSHPINYSLPAGIKASVEKQTLITLNSADKQLLGQVAAEIRGFRPPEPYKGKGIKYQDEVIRRKAGKAGKAAG